MPDYPAIDALEIEIRTGTGIAVIVEGESYAHIYCYDRWFGHLARQVTFFPQNGWDKVVTAVAELRQRCPGRPVYGIIDRDFAEDAALDANFATQGILRTPRYTVENYLLEPECWALVFTDIFNPFRRQGGVPDGWDVPTRVQDHIERAYRECLGLAAHNWVIKLGNTLYSEEARRTPETQRTYRERPGALVNINPADKLRTWGQQLGASEDLGALFEQKLSDMEQDDLEEWQGHVSGKYVLYVLRDRFPKRPGKGRFDLDYYRHLYLGQCPDPPGDLVAIINRILADAGL